jgi:uncharacterized protein YlxP (DUF503 family)
MPFAILTLHIELPGCSSLKQKRSFIRPALARLHREFNVASSELDLHDKWSEALLGFITLSNDATQCQRELQNVLEFTARSFPDLLILDHRIEFL